MDRGRLLNRYGESRRRTGSNRRVRRGVMTLMHGVLIVRLERMKVVGEGMVHRGELGRCHRRKLRSVPGRHVGNRDGADKGGEGERERSNAPVVGIVALCSDRSRGGWTEDVYLSARSRRCEQDRDSPWCRRRRSCHTRHGRAVYRRRLTTARVERRQFQLDDDRWQ